MYITFAMPMIRFHVWACLVGGLQWTAGVTVDAFGKVLGEAGCMNEGERHQFQNHVWPCMQPVICAQVL